MLRQRICNDIDVFPKCIVQTIRCDVSMFSMISNYSLRVSMNRSETTGQQFDNGQFYSKRQVGFFAIIASSVNVRAFPTFSALSASVVGKSTSKLEVSLSLYDLRKDLREYLFGLVFWNGSGEANHQSLQFVPINTQ